jgi:hypothetical protein
MPHRWLESSARKPQAANRNLGGGRRKAEGEGPYLTVIAFHTIHTFHTLHTFKPLNL